MNPLCRLAAFLLLASLLPATHAQTHCTIADRGAASMGFWHNDQLGLTYHYPDSVAPSKPDTLPNNSQSSFTILAAFWKNPHDLDEPDLFISADDPTLYTDDSALAYLHRIRNTVSGQFHAVVIDSDRPYRLSGIAFYRLDYQFPGANPPVYKSALTGRIGSCEVTFQLTAKTRNGIDELFRSVSASTITTRP